MNEEIPDWHLICRGRRNCSLVLLKYASVLKKHPSKTPFHHWLINGALLDCKLTVHHYISIHSIRGCHNNSLLFGTTKEGKRDYEAKRGFRLYRHKGSWLRTFSFQHIWSRSSRASTNHPLTLGLLQLVRPRNRVRDTTSFKHFLDSWLRAMVLCIEPFVPVT